MSECKNCSEYDTEKNYCPKFCEVIKHTSEDLRIQGAREFAEWLEYNSYLNWVSDGNDVNSISAKEVLAEWQKGAEE